MNNKRAQQRITQQKEGEAHARMRKNTQAKCGLQLPLEPVEK